MPFLDLLIWLEILVIVVIVVWWPISQVALPDPINKIVLILFVVVAAAIAIGILLSFMHGGLPAIGAKP